MRPRSSMLANVSWPSGAWNDPADSAQRKGRYHVCPRRVVSPPRASWDESLASAHATPVSEALPLSVSLSAVRRHKHFTPRRPSRALYLSSHLYTSLIPDFLPQPSAIKYPASCSVWPLCYGDHSAIPSPLSGLMFLDYALEPPTQSRISNNVKHSAAQPDNVTADVWASLGRLQLVTQ